MEKVVVVVGKHYWLTYNECRTPLIIKVYNIERNGLIGGLIYDCMTSEVLFSKGFHPEGPAWDEINSIPEGPGRDELVEVKIENIYEAIKADDLRDIRYIAMARIDDFFSSDTSGPLSKKLNDFSSDTSWTLSEKP